MLPYAKKGPNTYLKRKKEKKPMLNFMPVRSPVGLSGTTYMCNVGHTYKLALQKYVQHLPQKELKKDILGLYCIHVELYWETGIGYKPNNLEENLYLWMLVCRPESVNGASLPLMLCNLMSQISALQMLAKQQASMCI